MEVHGGDSDIGPNRGQQDEADEDEDHHDAPPRKQRKPPSERVRASRACDRCKARKTRCSGKYPCTFCSRLRVECRYTAEYRRGRLPSIGIEETVQHTEQPTRPQRAEGLVEDPGDHHRVREHVPSPVSIGNHNFQPPENGHDVSTARSSRNSPEPAQTDRQGHYVGPASGASFLLRIQRKLGQQPSASASDTSIFTFGDLPFPEFDSRFLILPPRLEAENLVARYYEFASATHRYTHRPTVEMWLQELYDGNGAIREQAGARSKTAVLLMVFASAENFPKSRAGKVDPTSSARYFSAAEDQLLAEKGAIRLTSVQARLLQCFYLLSHSRMNHCWSLFGTTAHLMLALGIHRKYRVDPNCYADHIDIECRKRTFWCAYNLDTYLSAALGRPRTFHDEDIDQELPLSVDDYRLSRGTMMSPPRASPHSVMSGSVAHIRLSRIVANILRDLYSIRPPSTENQHKLAEKYATDLEAWRSSVAYVINTDGVDPSLFQPIFLRQRNVLNLACWHAQILVHRPFLLNNFANLANLGKIRPRNSTQSASTAIDHVQCCLDAAMNIASKLDDLNASGQLYNTYWFSHYFAFCAVVILYVYAIQQRHSAPGTYLPAFHAATKCQELINSIATTGSLSQRYGVVLQELRLELLRHNPQLASLAAEQQEETNTGMGTLVLNGDENIMSHGDNVGTFGFSGDNLDMGRLPGDPNSLSDLAYDSLALPQGSPGSSVIQMTGWNQFDSLVMGGMGKVDSLLGDPSIDGWDLAIGDGITG